MSSTSRNRLPLALALTFALSAAVAGPALAAETVTTKRLAGDNRYETAAVIAQATFPSGSRTAVLASGLEFPDALAAAYANGRLDAPLLLTDPATLSQATKDQLATMNVSGVTIVGGTKAVSEAVAEELRALDYVVDRVRGTNRYGTARAIAELFPEGFVGSLGDGGPTAIVASGERAADALAGAPISYDASFPVLLTPKDSLSPDASAAFDKLAIKQVLLLGGTGAVSAAVESAIKAKNITVIRVFGKDRQETATQIADFTVRSLGWGRSHVNLARGDDFADALAGGPHAGVERTPVLLTVDANALGAPTVAWLQKNNDAIASIDVFGGKKAISDAVVEQARQAATSTAK